MCEILKNNKIRQRKRKERYRVWSATSDTLSSDPRDTAAQIFNSEFCPMCSRIPQNID